MSEQHQLFPDLQEWTRPPQKSYRAISHIRVRKKQSENDDSVHHPEEKIAQINRILPAFFEEQGRQPLSICEFFAGRGNLSREYEKYGTITALDQKYLKTGDSFLVFHRLISERKKFQVIDLDPYGFPSRMLPDIFLLIDDGILLMTFPKPNVNILNGIMAQHYQCYYNDRNPGLKKVIESLQTYSLCHWRESKILDTIDMGRLWRIAMRVKKVKATEYTGVRNH